MGSDQVDLREDLSSEQGGTGSASGSSVSASAYRGVYLCKQQLYIFRRYVHLTLNHFAFTHMPIFTFSRCNRLKR